MNFQSGVAFWLNLIENKGMDTTVQSEIENAVRILKEYGAREVYLFGSHAHGKARPNSDLDLAVTGIPPEKFIRAYGKVMWKLDRPVHLIDLDEDSDFSKFIKTNGELRSVG